MHSLEMGIQGYQFHEDFNQLLASRKLLSDFSFMQSKEAGRDELKTELPPMS